METGNNLVQENITLVEDYIFNFLDKDNLIDQWILTRTPYPSFIILSIYFLFVLKLGPKFMENRQPYDLNLVMRVYNIFQVLANVRLILHPVFVHYRHIPYFIQVSCFVPKETDENVEEFKELFLQILYGYLVLKIMDLFDTVFMVLRKKNSHVTVLHLYHHGIMVFGSWYNAKYLKPLQSVIPGFINGTVHIVMYSYFFLATFGEPVKKYLWWKKYLTTLQLAQFVFILVYICALYYNGCPVTKAFTYFWMFNVFAIFCLFVNFYITTYIIKPNTFESKKSPKKKK